MLALVSLGRGPRNHLGATATYFRAAALRYPPARRMVVEKSVDEAPKFGACVGGDDSGVVTGSCLRPMQMTPHDLHDLQAAFEGSPSGLGGGRALAANPLHEV